MEMPSKSGETNIFDPNGLGPYNSRPPLHPNTQGKSFKRLSRGKSASSNSGEIVVMQDINDLHDKWDRKSVPKKMHKLAKEIERNEKEREKQRIEEIENERKIEEIKNEQRIENERKKKKEQQRKLAEERHQRELNKKIEDSGCTVSGGRKTRKNKTRKNKRPSSRKSSKWFSIF
jgi:hypothetical protein